MLIYLYLLDFEMRVFLPSFVYREENIQNKKLGNKRNGKNGLLCTNSSLMDLTQDKRCIVESELENFSVLNRAAT